MNTHTIGTPRRNTRAYDEYLLKRAEKYRHCDEWRHDQTRQRLFERSFESRDLPDSAAAFAGENVSGDAFGAAFGHGAGLFARRPFSLISPADLAMARLDFRFWEEALHRAGKTGLLLVLRAMAYGATAADLGMEDRTFRRAMRKIEKILSAHPLKPRLG